MLCSGHFSPLVFERGGNSFRLPSAALKSSKMMLSITSHRLKKSFLWLAAKTASRQIVCALFYLDWINALFQQVSV